MRTPVSIGLEFWFQRVSALLTVGLLVGRSQGRMAAQGRQ